MKWAGRAGKSRGMNVIVTGGAGFIGSHVVNRLLGEGHGVVVIDDFNDYYNPAIKRGNVAAYAGEVQVVEGDIRDRELVRGVFREAGRLSLDVGPFVAALEYAAGVEAIVVGKPAPAFFHAAVADLGLPPGEVLMIGDDVEADVLGAIAAGLQGVLVRTGKFEPADERRLTGGPGRCVPDILAAVKAIKTVT